MKGEMGEDGARIKNNPQMYHYYLKIEVFKQTDVAHIQGDVFCCGHCTADAVFINRTNAIHYRAYNYYPTKQVGPLTTYAKTQCLCTHLTSFGGDMYVPPNTIDFNTVFTAERFLESMPVFCTVSAMIAVYLLVIIWARHMDKRDVARVRAVLNISYQYILFARVSPVSKNSLFAIMCYGGAGTNLKVGEPVRCESGGGHRSGIFFCLCPSTFLFF